VRLFEHPDFQQAILQATEHFRDRGLHPPMERRDTPLQVEGSGRLPSPSSQMPYSTRTIPGWARSGRKGLQRRSTLNCRERPQAQKQEEVFLGCLLPGLKRRVLRQRWGAAAA
jgi:hypothetical protein